MYRFALLLLLSLLPGLTAAQTLTRIVVVEAGTRTFLDGVTIQLQPVDPSNPVVEAVTTSANGSAGTAIFENVAPGTYYAFAAPGSGYATAITRRIEAGQFVAALELTALDAEAGRLEGTATDSESGEVLRFAWLAFDRDTAFADSLRFASTDADGRYVLPIGAGAFRGEVIVRTSGPDGDQAGYEPLALDITVPTGTVTQDFAFRRTLSGTISGVVTDDETGQPIQDAQVSASSSTGGNWIADVNADGSYTLRVPVDTYILRSQARSGTYIREFYDDVTTQADATLLTIGNGDAVANIDFALTPIPEAASVVVTGTLRSDTGAPARGVFVTMFSSTGGELTTDSTRADGAYRLESSDPRVFSSNVRVCFDGRFYEYECYDGAATLSGATPLATGGGSTVLENIDAELESSSQGTITGRVTAEDSGNGLGLTNVLARETGGGESFTTLTSETGEFRLQVMPGEYIVSVLPQSPYLGELYDDARTLSAATPVTVADSGTASGVDFTLARVADDFSILIEGTVSDAQGAPVRGALVLVLDPETSVASSAFTDGQGRYRFSSTQTILAGGDVVVAASDTTDGRFALEYYNGQPTLELADRLEIGTEATSFSGIDFVLSAPEDDLEGFALSGTVRSDMTDSPLSAATVIAVRTDAPGFRAVTTSASGAYRLDGLAAGTYTVLFTAGQHSPQFYPNADSWEQGETITISSDVPNVNALIGGLNRPVGAGSRAVAPFAGSPALLGAVRDGNGPLRGALVVARDEAGAATAFALSNGSGEFEIEALPAESVTLQVDLARYAVERRTLVPGGSMHLVSLSPRTTTAGQDTPEASGEDLSVFPNPARGNATVAFSLAESADVRVAVYDVLGREVAVLTDGPLGEGAHTATVETARMAPGLYVVRVESDAEARTARFTVVR